ncbi:MAG: conjugal transfer protein TraD [Sphingopyxis sp.]
MIYGAFLDLAARLRGEDGDAVRQRWKRRGAHALAEEAIASDRLPP